MACSGIPVHSGDIIVGDENGVIVVPSADAPAVLERLPTIEEKEQRRLAIEAGRSYDIVSAGLKGITVNGKGGTGNNHLRIEGTNISRERLVGVTHRIENIINDGGRETFVTFN